MGPTMEPWRVAIIVAAFVAVMAFPRFWPTPAARILRLCVAVQVGYAMLQDQFSACLCPEYFTVAHPPIVGLTEPTFVGMAWGLIGGFGGGVFMGVVIALAATAGQAPAFPPERLYRPLLLLILFEAVVTTICALSGIYNFDTVGATLGEPFAGGVAPERHSLFFAVACGHFGTYLSGVVGTVILSAWVVRQRSGSRN